MTWEDLGWQWVCWTDDYQECSFSDGGFEDDLGKIRLEARAHAKDNPTHVVWIERHQRRLFNKRRAENAPGSAA